MAEAGPRNDIQRLDLEEEFKHLLEEARTILPGIQALFGFQLIAVLNEGFAKKLTHPEQVWHLVATGLCLLSAGLAMCPAALHRQASPELVTRELVRLSTWSLASALAPLILAISIDFGLLAEVILRDEELATWLAVAVCAMLVGLWYVAPLVLKRRITRGRA